MSHKSTITDTSDALPAPLQELIHIIAKAVIEDYRLEIVKIPEHENHESSPIRPLQQR
jgi:hypothetical protein